MIGIKDSGMPNTCKECPYCIHTAYEKRYIGYCNTSDDDYYCKALHRFMEYDEVDDGLDILGKPLDCPLVEAIPEADIQKALEEGSKDIVKNVLAIVREEYINKVDYENRLKADMVAMLTDMKDELKHCEITSLWKANYREGFNDGVSKSLDAIQQKINSLKTESEG